MQTDQTTGDTLDIYDKLEGDDGVTVSFFWMVNSPYSEMWKLTVGRTYIFFLEMASWCLTRELLPSSRAG